MCLGLCRCLYYADACTMQMPVLCSTHSLVIYLAFAWHSCVWMPMTSASLVSPSDMDVAHLDLAPLCCTYLHYCSPSFLGLSSIFKAKD
ncbi:hypothetical protein BKA56DRAFT_590005 [Ilyonectria sp. MPI-CAGE-AT-0026]|nr:hypothetical protein BKA56DRAFT_590005 [Ilyonectria sp. MPI-CAGE-AT-0026]